MRYASRKYTYTVSRSTRALCGVNECIAELQDRSGVGRGDVSAWLGPSGDAASVRYVLLPHSVPATPAQLGAVQRMRVHTARCEY